MFHVSALLHKTTFVGILVAPYSACSGTCGMTAKFSLILFLKTIQSACIRSSLYEVVKVSKNNSIKDVKCVLV